MGKIIDLIFKAATKKQIANRPKKFKCSMCCNCVWYRDFPKQCRRIIGWFTYKDPYTLACEVYSPDRTVR